MELLDHFQKLGPIAGAGDDPKVGFGVDRLCHALAEQISGVGKHNTFDRFYHNSFVLSVRS